MTTLAGFLQTPKLEASLSRSPSHRWPGTFIVLFIASALLAPTNTDSIYRSMANGVSANVAAPLLGSATGGFE